MENKSIGLRIKELRHKAGLTQTDLAKLIGVSKQNLYKYENGIITNIPSDKIEALAKVLDTTPGYLMGWSDEIFFETNHIKPIGDREEAPQAYANLIFEKYQHATPEVRHMVDYLLKVDKQP